jgi:tetratricopeptide (TPR) repeat protein
MMVTLPVLLVLMDLWPLGRTRWWRNASVIDQAPAVGLLRLIFEKIPFAALALGASIVALLSQSSAGAMAGLGGRPISDRIATAILGYVRYLGTAFWPRNLSVFAAALLLGLITAFAVRLRKRQPYLLAGWIWYVVTLVPVIGIVQVGSQSMADRYTYLPFVGLSVAIIWTVTNFVNRRSYSGMIAILAGSAGLVGCIIVSRIYLACWANTLTLFGEAANLYPSDATIEAELGEGYRFANRPDQAIEHYDRSLQLNPNQFTAHTNLANGTPPLPRGDSDYPRKLQSTL